MNEQQPFDKLLAEKLRRLPTPDVNRSWEQMKQLLDKEDPPKAGFLPGRGWSIIALIAVLITSTLFFYKEFNNPTDNSIIGNPGTRQQASTSGTRPVSSVPVNTPPVQQERSVTTAKIDDPMKDGRTRIKERIAQPVQQHTTTTAENAPLSNGAAPETRLAGSTDRAQPQLQAQPVASQKKIRQAAINRSSQQRGNEPLPPANQITTANFTRVLQPSTPLNTFAENKPAPGTTPLITTPTRGTQTSDQPLALSEQAKRASARAIRDDKLIGDTKRDRKQINLADLYQPFTLKSDPDNSSWWAIGLSLNSVMATSGQTRTAYNVNAKSGTLSDYIPAPYVQYHFNNAVYVQTEINMSSPQHTQQLLLFRQPTTASYERSIYVQKLYYFNIPLSMHYSPLKNFYLAGGVQFSSFQSGVALFEERNVQAAGSPIASSRALKFKDDSIASKLSPNEWRWQTGADYYYKRFTLGMRYNRALKELVNITVAPNLPQTNSRNSAFTLFLRYNLYDGKKRDER